MTTRLNDAEWLQRQLGPDEYVGPDEDSGGDGEPDAQENPGATTDAGVDQELNTDLDESTEAVADGAQSNKTAGRGSSGKLDRKVLVRFGSLAAAAVVIVVLATTLLSGGGRRGGQSGDDSGARADAAVSTVAPTPVATETAGTDRALQFSASANCPAGSTSAQTLDGSDPTNAFVCVRDGVDGQVIRVDLPKTYVITAISLTPGWVGKDSSGQSQWEQHRVVTRVQYVLNDTEHTLIMQNTGNVHGEAVQPVKHVLASKITMLVLQTSRPPAEASTPPTPGRGLGPLGGGPLGGGPLGGGLFGSPTTIPTTPPVVGPRVGLGRQQTTDPVDSTFAISDLKIIGHEAI
jgi:hypothetical protein